MIHPATAHGTGWRSESYVRVCVCVNVYVCVCLRPGRTN